MMAEHDKILELAIHCTLKGGYPTTFQLSKDKKRAVQKRASNHFGITKTWKRVSACFYWKSLSADVQELVSP